MKPIHLPSLNDTQLTELDTLYRKTKDPRLRTRTQIILLSAGQQRKVPEIAKIVRESEATVLRWLKRYRAEGLEGLHDAPRAGRPAEKKGLVTIKNHSQILQCARFVSGVGAALRWIISPLEVTSDENVIRCDVNTPSRRRIYGMHKGGRSGGEH